jgi:DNA polymerase III delta subunit
LNLDKKDLDAGYFYYELLKLSLYTHSTSSGSVIDHSQSLKPGVKVGMKDYLEISESPEELNYFEWVKVVLEKQTAKALKHVPENEYEALGRLKSLINIFELLLVAEDTLMNTVSSPLTSLDSARDKSLGISQKTFLAKNSPFWVKNIRQWSSKMSYQEKQESLEKLLDFEMKVKTGRLSSIEALKLFVIG